MKIAVGSDHAGFELKQALVEHLRELGHDAKDMGTHSVDSVDYPDYARIVGEAVAAGEAERGVLVCGTGIGMAMSAGKVPGIRAANCSDEYSAEMSRRHNDANVLAMGARVVTPEIAKRVLGVWLDAAFDGGRHAGRIQKISDMDNLRQRHG